jgi:hypothetical protein
MTTRLASLAAPALLAVVAACAHERDAFQTTTITSGTAPEGVRVTNVPNERDPADRLAGELCQREATCGRIEANRTDEARLLGTQNCVTQSTPRARQVLGSWSCSPAANRAGFEECLAAVRSETCETSLRRVDVLPACRGEAVCAD